MRDYSVIQRREWRNVTLAGSGGMEFVQFRTNRTYHAGFKGTLLMDQCSGVMKKLVFQQLLCPKDVAGISSVATFIWRLGARNKSGRLEQKL